MPSVDQPLAIGALECLPAVVSGVDVSGLGGPDLALLLAAVRTVQRCLDGLVIRIGVRGEQLAAEGHVESVQDLVRGRGAVGSRQAHREAARASVAGKIEGLSEAASAGEVSGEHIDSIARHTAMLSDERRQTFDFAELVVQAGKLPVETFDRLVKRRATEAAADDGLGDTRAKQAASEFRHWFDQNSGMGRFSGSLDPERYEALATAIDQHVAAIANSSDEPVTKNRNLAAHALVELVTFADCRTARNRLPYVTVVVDHNTVAFGAHRRSVRQTENGHDLSPETVARLCCDSILRRVTMDRTGMPINVGRKYRTATDAQWAAIKAIYIGCAWDGCEAPINWCQAHHIREWERGGDTDLQNLIPLCTRHHHRVHEGRWSIKLLADRTLKIHTPDGGLHTTVPTPLRC